MSYSLTEQTLSRARLTLRSFMICGTLVISLASCVRVERRGASALAAPIPYQPTTGQIAPQTQDGRARVHLNSATHAELERLPGIGATLAARIIAHRERYGRFRRAEHVIIVRGMSESRFRRIQPFLTTD